MNNTKKTDIDPDRIGEHAVKPGEKNRNEFASGLVTFIVFIIFMTVWMYLGLTGVIEY